MTRPRNTALARTRQERRELRQLMAHVEAAAREMLASAIEEGLIEGHIEDGEVVIVDDPLAPSRRRK
jgi:hypothetical protein